ILAALAGALTLAACGTNNGKNGAPSASEEDKAFEGAVKFSRCMRQHGVDMPDPVRVGQGGIRVAGPAARRLKMGQVDPKMKTAEKACSKYMEFGGGGPAMDPAQQARMQDAFFAYARCMRSKGIDMPDPKVSSHGVQMSVKGGPGRPGPGKGGPGSPVFNAADGACHHFLAQVEPKGASSKFSGPGKGVKSAGPVLEQSR
ncbi:MAG: hypothetical protein QOJ29_4025, partial [Thermoleophilaceae bacterium]|nr:hypothetical protein [Thermoleophilaceae bacterium]